MVDRGLCCLGCGHQFDYGDEIDFQGQTSAEVTARCPKCELMGAWRFPNPETKPRTREERLEDELRETNAALDEARREASVTRDQHKSALEDLTKAHGRIHVLTADYEACEHDDYEKFRPAQGLPPPAYVGWCPNCGAAYVWKKWEDARWVWDEEKKQRVDMPAVHEARWVKPRSQFRLALIRGILRNARDDVDEDDHERSLSPEARKVLDHGLETADDSKLVTWEPPPLTREDLLDRLVDLIEIGGSSHTDVLNCLADLLDAETKHEPDAPWVAKLRDVESKL